MYDRVIVKQDEAEKLTESGLIIPDTAQQKPERGTVIAVGPGRNNTPMVIKKGDRVMFSKHQSTPLPDDLGPDLVIMREPDVWLVIE